MSAAAFVEKFSSGKFPIGKVVDFNSDRDRLYPFDFTSANAELNADILADTPSFSRWITGKLDTEGCRYGIGGYDEHRTIYARSTHFDGLEEPRRLHLGVDIWAAAGTPVFNFYPGKVHSFAFNDHFGDYGATIIMQYQLDDLVFYALYGHLSLASLHDLQEGKEIGAGEQFATFGEPSENGHWPPHLHFQLILDIKGFHGDYPGVCRYSERERFLQNSPDPQYILKSTFGDLV